MRFRGRGRTPFFALATCAIATLDIAVFAHELGLREGAAREAYVDGYALIPYDLVHGVWPEGFPLPAIATLVTSQFLHGSVSHLFVNLLFFIVFAPEVEFALGALRFALFYLACGVAGGLAQASVTAASHVPDIGASGAIAGVLGAYLVRFPTHKVVGFPAFLVIGLWAALQFVHGFGPLSTYVLSERGGGTAYFAHIGGFLAGVILAGFFTRRRRTALRRGRSPYYSG
jgi:membrane associated rhomboid family serine protease